MDGWVDGWMDGWMGGWVDGWMGGWVDGWMGGWMDGWMGGWIVTSSMAFCLAKEHFLLKQSILKRNETSSLKY